jgi:peptidoglycan lytic transglycosylase
MYLGVAHFIFISLFALASGPGPVVLAVDSPTLQNRANEIRAAMDAREFERAEHLVTELRSGDPGAFTRNNYDYLLARLAERRGASEEATSLYKAIVERNSVLTEFALWRLARLARETGDLANERQYLSRLLTRFPASSLARLAKDRMIDSLMESGEYGAAATLLKPLASSSGVQGRSAMAQLAEAYEKSGDAASARSVYEQLASGSRDDYALAAAEGLDRLDAAAGSLPNEFDATRRARIYLSNRHWPEARRHLLSVIQRFPDSQNRAEAVYQTGMTFFREDGYDDAVRWFQRAHDEFPEKKEGEQGYYWVGSALQRAKRYEDAARRYIEFIDAYPNSDLLEGAYRNVVDCFRYADKQAEAIEWSRRTAQRFAGKPLESVGLFNEAKIELSRGDFEAALALLTRLEARPAYPRLFGGAIRGEATFLRIYALERLGRLSEAARLYLAIPDGRDDFFGYRATMRLRSLAGTDDGRRIIEPIARSYMEQARSALSGGRYSEAKDAATQALRLIENPDARKRLVEILRTCYRNLPAYAAVFNYRVAPVARLVLGSDDQTPSRVSHQALASELIFLGLYDDAARELRAGGLPASRIARSDISTRGAGGRFNSRRASRSRISGFADPSYSLAVYSNRGDLSQYAIAYAEPLFRSIPRDFQLELIPRDLAELLYPAPYRDALTKYAAKFKVDPRLVLSLARQESRFDPSVKSPQAARGLLQFIAETAMQVAREEGLEGFRPDDVYEPEVSVRLAMRYLSNMLRSFAGHTPAVIAAYNTGEPNVERWIYRARSNDPDRLLTEIAIPETKDYFAKVLLNLRAYQLLYTKALKPRER